MITLNATEVRDALPWTKLIGALRSAFVSRCEMPLRHHHQMPVPGEPEATMLLMPAWIPGEHIGVKVVNVMPGNSRRGLPAIAASYLLSDGVTGEMLAMIDGGELTARRTAAASALAADYLARRDAKELLIVGTGRLSSNLAQAHAAVRPIERIFIWGRDLDKATRKAESIQQQTGIHCEAAITLEGAARDADIISTCTLSTEPLIAGEWLKPGSHLDLVGAFSPDMRESDDHAMQRGEVYVDTRDGATQEGGDIVQAIASGALKLGDIRADLYDLCGEHHAGRSDATEITVFKSVGTALEDLAAARLAVISY
ncbi:ornithine cyclodeaminase family protein [Gammaproteobacteria bacterium]|nr:ornithine cyclodeaminase family protein [Gammaproteobacteria bacterium]